MSKPRRSADPSATWQGVPEWGLSFAVVLAIVGLAVLFPPGEWYASLNKPTWQPPGWVFAPLWSILFGLQAASFGLILSAEPGPDRSRALRRYALMWLCSALWAPLFFGLQMPLLAFVDFCALWLALLYSLAAAARIRQLAAWLLVPPLLWVSFALVLNGVIVALNGG
ncbi:MAG: TspO/MBR family protein [Lysobacteraceae bacterium]